MCAEGGIAMGEKRACIRLPPGTSKEFASGFGSPRLARRLIYIQFWGQKRIGGFVGKKKKI